MKLPILLVASALFVYVTDGFAQEDKAILTGLVTDTSEAAVPDATIEVSSPTNGFLRKAESNHVGSYTIGGLPVGVHVDHGCHGCFLQGFRQLNPTAPPRKVHNDLAGAFQNALHDPSHSSGNRLLPQAQGPR